ncbi:hypothetical protein J4441_05595 [Candidatus Micrarchaeota archaeon]|nr:hypothetical protein [Candidatus Micrarchaeota archaeon]
MAIVNLKIEGWLEGVVDWYIKNGFATSKTEVLRMGLIKLGEDRERLGGFIAKNANRDIWENKKEDAIWDKY